MQPAVFGHPRRLGSREDCHNHEEVLARGEDIPDIRGWLKAHNTCAVKGGRIYHSQVVCGVPIVRIFVEEEQKSCCPSGLIPIDSTGLVAFCIWSVGIPPSTETRHTPSDARNSVFGSSGATIFIGAEIGSSSSEICSRLTPSSTRRIPVPPPPGRRIDPTRSRHIGDPHFHARFQRPGNAPAPLQGCQMSAS